jgi:acyl-coenzyme A synthetase/AMP-(fatty) acid ligase
MAPARLSQRPLARRSEAAPVAFGRDGARSVGDLGRDAAGLAAAIDKVGRGRWLVHTADPYAGAVALLAIAETRSVAVLAPNAAPATLSELSAGARGAIVDDATPLPARVTRLAASDHPPGAELRQVDLDPDASIAEFRTSGTTRRDRAVTKALRHLDDEVAVLERLFGERIPDDASVFSTVSHQHIYGLLFRMLWPLLSGRPFQRDTLLHTAELVPRMRDAGSCALVTTPAHLKRMTSGGGLAALRGHCCAVFSSGAPLDRDCALQVRDDLGAAPIEILGSTETGGVALRQRDVTGELWQPFPGVEAERGEDQRLRVVSPFASVGEPRGRGRAFVMGDRVEFEEDGRFALRGRADRTVKIAGKRLALPDMEQALEAHDCVEEAALVVGEAAGEPRVLAVVVPTRAGRHRLCDSGRRGLANTLGEDLATRFDRVLLPRAWRVAAALPRNAQGKLPAAELRRLFEERPREPLLLREELGDGGLVQWLEVVPELACLEGHFEGRPVVPGVAILGWAIAAGERLRGERIEAHVLEAVKFPTPLLPGDRFTLRVEIASAPERLRFLAESGERTVASGRVLFEPGATT